MSSPSSRPILIIGMAIALLILGTIGYVLIEGWTVLDAFYMTVITLSTVGFSETHPLSQGGRLFTTGLVMASIFLIVYGVEFIISARLGGQYFRRRQMERQISNLSNHVIVCGYGRVGQSAIVSLRGSGREIVIIEKVQAKLASIEAAGLLYVEGDGTRDEVLLKAGVERADGLIVTGGDDSVNLFVVLSARALNPNLHIVARSVNAENERKMRLAGADRVVSPYQIGGQHMANIMIRPHVTDFFDVVTLDGGIELWVEELVIDEASPLVGKTVGEVDIRRETGVTIVAIYRSDEGQTTMPRAATKLRQGDGLIVLGTRQQLSALQALVGGDTAVTRKQKEVK